MLPRKTSQIFNKTITINAPASVVWAALTGIDAMKEWMSQPEIEIITGWKVGNPIIIHAPLYKKHVENKGIVLIFEPGLQLRYTHLSSLSRLEDKEENYTLLDFTLISQEGQTVLTITITNFPTETIYKHLAFYWNVTMEVFKKFVERQ